MVKDQKIWIANNEKGDNVYIHPSMVNRHGLIAGATGTGKTVTLKVMAEAFSEMGVPVFMADVKGDISGLMNPGVDSADMQERIQRFKLEDFTYQGYPVCFWDIYGKNGIQLRTTISEMGPLLLGRILGLNETQADILQVLFKIADDQQLLLVDTKDLKALLAYVDDHSSEFAQDYGKISSASIGVITRAIVAMESQGADTFFGEPGLNFQDWLTTDGQRGMIHILDSSSLINNGTLYSTFLLWMLSELFEMLPEVGDLDKPKMVFFFDEAHLLFNNASKALLDKVEQVVKLIRSKGVGVYFCTQNPKDVPDGVLAQLANKVQHGLHAYTPADQRAVRAAADSFRENPDFDTYETLLNLGKGEAVVSFLQEDGIPGVAQKVNILPIQSNFAAADASQKDHAIKSSLLFSKYANPVDPDSAYEFLQRKGIEDQQLQVQKEQEAQKAKEEAKAEKEAAKQAEKEAKALEKQKEKEQREKERAIKNVGNSVVSTVGREVGKQVGKHFGTFGKQLGGNVGSSLGRGLLNTLFKK